MRRAWRWLMMTFRWLLVPALPVLGLVLGLCLKPEARPQWEYQLETGYKCSGLVVEDEMTYMVMSHSRAIHNGSGYQDITTINVATGKEAFSRTLIQDESRGTVELIPSTRYALFLKRKTTPPTIVLYDWKEGRELQSFDGIGNITSVNALTYSQGILTVQLEDNGKHRIVSWKPGNSKPSTTFDFEDYLNVHTQLYQASPDGRWAILLFHRQSLIPKKMSESCAKIIDLETGKAVQSLSETTGYVCWHPVDGSFLALCLNVPGKTQYWQRFQYVVDQFVPIGPRLPIPFGFDQGKGHSPLMAQFTTSMVDPIRMKISKYSGEWGRKLLDRLWPDMNLITVYRTESGELINSVTIPQIDWGTNLQFSAFPDPNSEGVILQIDNTLSYWQFNPASRWYWRVGLGVGILLSALVARWNLKRRMA